LPSSFPKVRDEIAVVADNRSQRGLECPACFVPV
jgi:hypothetical protein